MGGISWLAAIIDSPLTGVQRRWPKTMHAITAEDMRLRDWHKARTLRSACGRRVAFIAMNGDVVLWPVQHRLPGDLTRCRECWELTGKKRPRSHIEASGAEP